MLQKSSTVFRVHPVVHGQSASIAMAASILKSLLLPSQTHPEINGGI